MRRSKIAPGTADDIEAAFYDALQHADLDKLMACWADEEDVVCMHPGGGRLVGHAAVRAAFEALFAHGAIRARPEQVRRIDAGHCQVHCVVERLDVTGADGPAQVWVQATNVYAKTVHGWRLIVHHASPAGTEQPQDATGAPAMLH